MENIWHVFRYELTRNLKRKAFIITAFGIPLLAFALFMVVQATSSDANEEAQQELIEESQDIPTVGYVDRAGFIVTDPGDYIPFETTEAAEVALENEEIDQYYIIGENYGETGELTVVLPRFTIDGAGGAGFESFLYRQMVEDADNLTLSRLQYPATVQRVQFDPAPVDGGTVDSDGEVVDEENTSGFIIVYGFGMIFMLALFGTNGYLMQSVIEEKESRIVEIIISAVRPIQLLAGKILALGVLGIIQIVAWVGTILLMTQLVGSENVPGQLGFLADLQLEPKMLLIAFIYFVLGYLFFAAMFGAIGAISVSMSEGPNYSMIFTIPVVIPFLILNVFIDTPNDSLPTFLSIFPVTSPMAMVMRAASTGGDIPLGELVLSIGLLILLVIAGIWFAGRLFRVNTLLAGQVPKPKDLVSIIRG